MRSIFAAIISVALLFGGALAQQQSPPSDPQMPQAPMPRSDEQPNPPTQPGTASTANQPAGHQMKIAPGSVIPVQLTKTVDAKKAKTGDEVVATVTQDMKTSSGDVLVPKDTKVIGHVTEAQARNKEQKQSELGIAFDRAVVKGDQMQLPMSIQAVIAPPSSNGGGAGGAPEQAPSAQGGGSPMGGTRPGAGGTSPNAQGNYPQSGGNSESAPQTGSARPLITGNTQGVIGMSDVKLEAGPQASQQGSVLTSEKNNVKIEKGTMMLLRVNQ